MTNFQTTASEWTYAKMLFDLLGGAGAYWKAYLLELAANAYW